MSANQSQAKIGLAIDSIYEAATAPSRWPEALDAVAKCTDGRGRSTPLDA
jgi:hypothetical protein